MNRFDLLERTTATVLVLVLAVLGWMILAANIPALGDWPSVKVQVVVVLALVLSALGLVSLLALLNTR